MEILTPAIQHDNKNIRVYWNIDKRTVVLIITNLEDNKRVKREDYPPLVYSSTNDYEDVDKFQQMFARDIRGKSNAFFGLNIGMDNANKLANALINYSDMHHVLGRTKEANEVLDEIDNKEFAHIFQEVQQEIEKDGLEDPTPNDQPHVETSSNTTEVYNNGLGKTPKDNFKDYIDQYHKNELRNINEGVELPQTIVIDWQELKEFDKELANMLISKAEDTLELMQNGLLELTTNRALDIDEDVKIRFDNLEVTPTKQLLANKIGQMVQTEGIIKGILEPSFYYTTAVFECKGCKRLHEVKQTMKDRIIEPSICSECGGRNFRLLEDQSTAEDLKYIRLQEPTDDLNTDERPRNILCCLTGNLSHDIVSGQRVKITGVLKGNIDDKGNRKFVLDANNVVKMEDKKIEITDEDKDRIIELSKHHNILDILVNSFAPNLIIDREIKLAILCFLVNAGYTEELREQIHILIIGDPGTAKTQLKNSAHELAEKGIKTSGTNASGVGLTGAVDRDPVLNVPMVTAGAMPMANNGHLFIDECEKMPKEEQQRILDGMESGEIPITKWGLMETLPAHTSIFAIGNPVYGRFDPYKTDINEQLNIYPPLLSRYDIVIALEDKQDATKDRAIGKSILNKFRPGNDKWEDDTTQIDQELLQKYLAYARNNYNPVPVDNEELDTFLLDYYLDSRAIGKDARSFEAVNRFAGAIAKLQLHDQINVEDYQQAIDMQNYSLETLGMEPLEGKIDIDNVRGNTNNKDRENRKKILKVMDGYINSVENLEDEAIPKNVLLDECQKQFGMGKTTFYNAFSQLKNGKEIYEHHRKVYFKH